MLHLRLGAPCPCQIFCSNILVWRPDMCKSMACLLACITTEILQKGQVQALNLNYNSISFSLLSFYFNCKYCTRNRGAFYLSPLSSPSKRATKKLAWELSKIESIPCPCVGRLPSLPSANASVGSTPVSSGPWRPSALLPTGFQHTKGEKIEISCIP